MALQLFALVFLFVILAVGTRMAVSGLATTIVPVVLLTSLSEFSIAIVAAIAGKPEISLANLLGANVVNLSVVIGGATVIAGVLPVVGNYFRFELAAVFFAGIAPILLLMDGGLSRLDGLILIIIYLIYLRGVVVDGKMHGLIGVGGHRRGLLVRIKEWRQKRNHESIILLFFGMGLLIFSAMMIVKLVTQLAPVMGMSVVVFSMVVVSLGTTLPELISGLRAATKKEVALIMANLFGSIVTNATLVVGILALISPFSTGNAANYSLVNMAFVIVFGLFWLFTLTKRKLERFEGVILIGSFLVFVGLELMLGI